MHAWINDYIDIENNLANHRRKGLLLERLLARIPASEQIAFEDVLMLLVQLQEHDAKLRMPLFARVVYPVLEREIEAGNLQAIKRMLRHIQMMYSYYRMMKSSTGYTEIGLIDRYLQRNPDDREVLQQKEVFLDTILYHSTHELPHGILYGMYAATEEECERLLDVLHEYEDVCQHLQYDRRATIDYYTMHLKGYRDYLREQHLYANYQEYIRQHQLKVRTTYNYYYSD